MSTLAIAIELAAKTYGCTPSRDGKPAVFHPLRVMMAEYEAEGDDRRIVGALHDLVEDWPGWTLHALRERGFAPHIIDAIDAITRREGEEYMAYIARCAVNEIARDVKLADLADNMRRCDMSPSAHNRSLHRRYAAARDYIEGRMKAEIYT